MRRGCWRRRRQCISASFPITVGAQHCCVGREWLRASTQKKSRKSNKKKLGLSSSRSCSARRARGTIGWGGFVRRCQGLLVSRLSPPLLSRIISRNAFGGFLYCSMACLLDVRRIKTTRYGRIYLPGQSVDYYCQHILSQCPAL